MVFLLLDQDPEVPVSLQLCILQLEPEMEIPKTPTMTAILLHCKEVRHAADECIYSRDVVTV